MTQFQSDTMRAIVVHRHGGPDVLTLETQWPRPVAGPGEIVVRVEACALNFFDIFARRGMPGQRLPLPLITGGDVAGVVSDTGDGVEGRMAGRRVLLDPHWGCGQCEYCRQGETTRCIREHMLGESEPGGLAEYVKCPAEQAIEIPGEYPFDLAACLPTAFASAWRMLLTRGGLKERETVVVLGAAGGVALAAIQISKLVGARVIAIASSAEKLAMATRSGADETIDYSQDRQWHESVRRLTEKRGADVIVDTVGQETWESSIRALGKGGRLLTCGATSGPIGQTDIRYLFRREQSLIGSNGWTRSELRQVAQHAFAGRIRPIIDRVLPLEKTAEGELALEGRNVIGKIVISPGNITAA